MTEPCILCDRKAWDAWLERHIIRDGGASPALPHLCERHKEEIHGK